MEPIEKLVVAAIVAILLFAGGGFLIDVRAEQKCLSHGWRDHHVAWTLTTYCSRMENQTMVTKPLSEIEAVR